MRYRIHHWVAGLLLPLLAATASLAAPPPVGATIRNTASLSYLPAGGTNTVLVSNPVDTIAQAPDGGGGPSVTIRFFADDTFSKIAYSAHLGDPLFLQAVAPGCNTDPNTVETRAIILVSTKTGDSETFTATETAVDSGVFRVLPAIPTRSAVFNAVVPGNAIIESVVNDSLRATITGCSAAAAETTILIDPAGVVFDSQSNAPVGGVSVTLINAATGSPAEVFDFDGVTPAPSTIVTGADGSYQFPRVAAGTYRLQVTPPPSHAAPSSVAAANLPAGRTIDASGSYGGNFLVPSNVEIVLIDFPVDPVENVGGSGLFVQKTASRTTAEVGDLIDYTVRVQNVSGGMLDPITVTDQLPAGFLYVKNSARLDGAPVPNPSGGRGPLLAFDLGAVADNTTVALTYRLEVGPGALRGNGVNEALATAPGATSNRARVRVQLEEGVFTERGTIIGKVYVDRDGNRMQDADDVGIPGVRVFMEDGTFAITDSEGKYNFFGVTPRTHVVKVDVTTLPRGAKLIVLDNRHAFDAGSRFVDLKTYELHKADFAVGSPSDAVLAEIIARRARDEVDVAETQHRLGTDLTPDGAPKPTADPKSLPAAGRIGEPSLNSRNSSLMKEPVMSVPRAPLVEEAVTSELGFVDLRDGDTLPLAQTHVRVTGQDGAAIRLTVNGQAVPDRQVGRRVRYADQQAQLVEFVGVTLQPGRNQLVLTQVDEFGNTRGTTEISVIAPDRLGRLQLRLPGEAQPADGQTPAIIEVLLTDASGTPVSARTPVTLEASAGRWDVRDLDSREPGVQVFVEGGRGEFALLPPTEPGNVQVRATSGVLEARETLAFLPELRPLIAVGVIEGALNVSRLNMRSLVPARKQDGFEQELTSLSFSADNGAVRGGARAAFFLKGKIKGDYLLTASYDSDKDTRGRLFRDIQPDEFYPVYGDASVRGFDAQSTGRLYVRVDKNKSYLLYGDFNTGSDREAVGLGNYSRSLTGVKERFETDRLSVTGWATRDSSRQVVQELPGNGTSGPYFFTTGDGLENSEKVEILVRDRNQPSIILSSELLARFVDYEFEPFTGRLLFRRPVPSLDENLNPISIRVTFEVDQGGDEFWMYGGEARFKVSSFLEVGGNAVRDENPLAEYELYSANATVQLSPYTRVIGELAQSDDALAGQGSAGRVEVRHRSPTTDARFWFAQTDEEFVNPSANMSSGRQEMGVTVTRRIGPRTQLRLDALRTDDEVSDVERWDTRLDLAHTFESQIRGELGFRHSEERFDSGPDNDVTSVRTRLGFPIPKLPAASIYGEYEQDVTDINRQMIAAGGEYAFQNRGRLYARHEFISELGSPIGLDDNAQRNNTVVGIDTDYMQNGQFFNEYRLRDGVAGRDGEAAFGLRNQWHVADNTRLHTTFERINPIQGNPGNESTAGTLAVAYLPQADWKATGRVELRTGDQEDSALNTLGYARKLDDNWTMLAKSIIYASDVKASGIGGKLQSRLQLGAAWRQTNTNVWNGLLKYEFKYEDDDTQVGAALERYVHIISSTVNWQPTEDLWISGTYAAKFVTDDSNALRSFNHAHLLAGRVIFDLTDRWDVGLNASAFFDGELGRVQYGLGPEIGFILTKNLRVGAGYNLFGYQDDDLGASEYTNHGVFVTVRYKFDERLFGRREEEAP